MVQDEVILLTEWQKLETGLRSDCFKVIRSSAVLPPPPPTPSLGGPGYQRAEVNLTADSSRDVT